VCSATKKLPSREPILAALARAPKMDPYRVTRLEEQTAVDGAHLGWVTAHPAHAAIYLYGLGGSKTWGTSGCDPSEPGVITGGAAE